MAGKFELNDSTPAAPAGRLNILWQHDLNGNVSAHVPASLPVPVSSVFGRTGDVVAQMGDYAANLVTNAVDMTQTYSDPAWIASIAWSKITDAPAFFPPAAHVHNASDVTAGVFAPARLGTGTADATTYLRGDGTWATVSSGGSQTPWLQDINGGGFKLTNTSFIGIKKAASGITPLPFNADTLLVVENTGAAYIETASATSSCGLLFSKGSSLTSYIVHEIGANELQLCSANPIAFHTIGVGRRMMIDAAGNVGIARTPDVLLDVNGTTLIRQAGVLQNPPAGSGKGLRFGFDSGGRADILAYDWTSTTMQPLDVRGSPVQIGGGNTWVAGKLAVGIGQDPGRQLEVVVGIDDWVSRFTALNYGWLDVSWRGMQSYTWGAGYGPLFLNPSGGNVGVNNTNPQHALDVYGNISVNGSSGFKIYTWSPGDLNWRFGMAADNTVVGFARTLANSHVEYTTFASGPGQGFAVGDIATAVSAFEVCGSGSSYRAFFRGEVNCGTTTRVCSDRIEINQDFTSGNRLAYIDLHSDDTYTDFSARLIRWSGADGNTDLISRGYGALSINAENGGVLNLSMQNNWRLQLQVSGNSGVHMVSRTVGTNYNQSALQVRETNLVGYNAGTSYAPRISFHWGGVVASQIGMSADGWIRTFDNPGTGLANFAAGTIHSYGELVAKAGLHLEGNALQGYGNGGFAGYVQIKIAGTMYLMSVNYLV